MRVLSIIVILALCSCASNSPKPTTTDWYAETFVYFDFFTQSELTSNNDFDLRLFVSRANQFSNRLEQIEYALEITGYGISLELSDYPLDKLPPSPYLDVNQLMSVKQYIRLAGFNDQTVVIDTNNKLIAYFKTGSDAYLNVVKSKPAPLEEPVFAHVQKTDEKVEESSLSNEASSDDVQTQAVAIEKPLGLVVDQDMLIQTPTDEITQEDGFAEIESEDDALSIDLPVSGLPVENMVGVVDLISINQGLTLDQIFNQVAQSQNMQYINSMGINAWFLNSTMNHEYEFDGFDHALGLLLGEANRILQSNNIDFLLKASTANNNLEIYYE